MNLEKMLQTQKEFDNKVIAAKGLKGQDLIPNTFVALITELGEFANEGRWFKHWSEDQEPTSDKYHWIDCEICKVKRLDWENCDKCQDGLVKVVHERPLLEEYADCTHFFLSIAIQKGWKDALFISEEQLDPDDFDGALSEWYLEMVYFINRSYMEVRAYNERIAGIQTNEYLFRLAWILFLNIGINGFGFTTSQIEQAYFDKNKINHARQENGY